jgi:hypothetical protein
LINRNFIQYVSFVLLSLAICAGQAQRADSAREQSSFSEASPIRNPVPLPPDVLKLLLRRPEVMQNWAEITDAEKKNPAHLFTAAEIDLGTSGDVDLIVEGGPLMAGADNDWFWIVLSAHKNPRIVLFAGGNSFEVLGAKTNGYRDIRSEWASASEVITEIYKFDGVNYKLWKKRTRENKF